MLTAANAAKDAAVAAAAAAAAGGGSNPAGTSPTEEAPAASGNLGHES